MKVLANETKRILAVLLSVAMIFAYVPNNVAAYADGVSDDNAPAVEEATEEIVEDGGEVADDSEDYYIDADITFAALNAGTDDSKRKVISLAGDKAGIFVDEDTTETTAAVDSTRDTVFYVAPLMGYNWDDGYSATTPPVTLKGSYKLKGAAEAVELTKGTDYTVEKSDVKLVNAGATQYYDTYDFDQAYKVTIKGTYEGSGSTFMKYLAKYKTALAQDGVTAPAAGTAHVNEIFDTGALYDTNIPGITVLIAEDTNKSKSGISATKGKVGIGAVTYSSELTDPEVSLEQDAYRWEYDAGDTNYLYTLISEDDDDKAIEATLSLVPKQGDPIQLEEGATKDYKKWDGELRTLELTTAQVNKLYSLSRDVNGGYKLKIDFAVDKSSTFTPSKVGVKASSEDYYTMTASLSAAKPTEAIHKNTALEVSTYDDLCINTMTQATGATDATRQLQGLKYVVGDSKKKDATPAIWAYALQDDVSYGGESYDTGERIYRDDTSATTISNFAQLITDGKASASQSGYVISVLDLVGDVVLYPVSGEQVTVKGGNNGTAAIIDYSVNNVAKTISGTVDTVLNGNPDGTDVDESAALTGEDYTFTVAPKNGYRITAVDVDMYDKAGSAPTRYSVGDATHPLTRGDYGEYTVPAITGKLDVLVTAVADSTTKLSITKIDDTLGSNIKLYRLSDKKEITGTVQMHENGDDLLFKAVAENGYAVKKVSITSDGTNYQDITSTGVNDGKGGLNFTVSNLRTNLTIKVEGQKGFTFRKITNPYATVKVNGIVVGDNKTLTGVAAGDGVEIEVTGKDSEVKNVWYTFIKRDPATATNIKDEDTVKTYVAGHAATAKEISATGGVVSATMLNDIPQSDDTGSDPVDAVDSEFMIYVKTERAEDPAKYAGKIVTGGTPAINATTKGLTLYSGGDKLDAQGTDVTQSTLTTTFTRKDAEAVDVSDENNTTYTLGVTDLTAAARFGAQKVAGKYNVLTTTSVANTTSATDTITAKEVEEATNWMDTLSYTATATLTVKPLAELYAGYDFVATFGDAGGIGVATHLSGDVLRAYTTGVATYDDNVALTILPYTLNTKGEKVTRTKDYAGNAQTALADAEVSGSGSKLFIKSIAYGTTPKYSGTAVDGPITVNAGPASYTKTGRTISKVKQTGTVTVTSDIEFADGSKTTVTKTIPVVPQTYGYFALPVIKVNGSTKLGYGAATQTMDLALTQTQATSGQIQYRVFEDLKGEGASTLLAEMTSEEEIEKLKVDGRVSEITTGVTFSDADGVTTPATNAIYNKNVTATVAGNTYTVTAAKIVNAAFRWFRAVGKVNTTPIYIDPIKVTVGNKLTTYTVTMDLTDATGADLPDATVADVYKYPLLDKTKTDGKALLDIPHSDIETDTAEDDTKGYVFDGMAAGQTIKLPDVTAFKDVNPKRTLIGWTISDGATSNVPVNTNYVIKSNATITPIWAYKYTSSTTASGGLGDGKVSIYSDEKDAALTASEKLAKGTTITLSTRAYTINWDKTPTLTGTVEWSEDPVKLTGTTKADKANTSDDSLTIPATGATITGAKTTAGSTVSYTFTDDAYSYATRTVGDDLTVEGTSFVVETPVEWNVEMDNIEVEEGVEAPFKVYVYKKGNKDDGTPYTRDDAVNFGSDGAKLSKVMTSIVAGGEDYALSEEDRTPSTGENTVMVRGLEAGKTATLLLTVVTEQNIAIPVRVPISVKSTKKQIVVKQYGSTAALKDEKGTILIPVASTAATTNILFALEEDGTEQTTGTYNRWAFKAIEPDEGTEAERINVVTSFAQKSDNTAATATLTQVANKDGQGQVEVKYVLDTTTKKAFYQTLDVKTYYEIKFAGKVTADTTAFTVKKGTKAIAANATSSEKIVYDGQKVHTVSEAAIYTATLDVPDENLTWLGWSVGAAANFTAQKATYAAQEAIVLDEASTSGATAWPFKYAAPTITVTAQFGPNPVDSITGFDNVIRLTDESPAKADDPTAKSTTSKTLTDYAVEDITARPGSSGADIYVTADDIGMFTIVDGNTPNREDLKAVANNANAWNTVSLLGTTTPSVVGFNTNGYVKVGLTPNLAKTFRDGSFSVAKVPGQVGVSKIKVTSGSLEYEIPVYVNGAYVDTTVTPNVERYMEDGENFLEGTKTVDGDTKYYKDGAVITDGVVFVTVGGEKKLVMIAKSKQIVTPAGGTKSYDDKNYYIGTDGYLKFGGLFSGEGATDKDKKYYADENGVLATSELKEINGVTYYFNSKSEMAVATATANTFELDPVDHKYYVDKDGNVAIANLFTMDGKQYLANEKGELVTYAMTTAGKITINGVGYIVDQTDNTAKPDHTDHKWAFTSMNWAGYSFETQTGTVTAKFTCEVGKEEGTAPATVKVENKAVKGTETELGYSVFKFTATADKDPSGATVSKPATETVYKQFRGGAWMDATEADWKAAGGESGESKTPGETESEPAKSEVASYQSYNLFFSSQRTIAVPGLQDAISAGGTFVGGKKGYYSVVEGEDAVTITSTDKKDIKAAANAANSLITAGAFTYQLPVYYQKPTLKLSSTKGIRKKNDSAVYTFKTSVLEKKSSGNFEPIALEEGDITANSKLAGVLALTDGSSAITTDETTVSIATIKKGSGKLLVQAKDGDKFAWAEPVELSYSVTENAKDVIDISAKTVNMNVQATKIVDATPDTQTVTVKVNGQNIEDLPDGTTVTADLSKISGKGVTIDGIDADGKVSASELKFGYDSTTITKGTYKIKLTAGTGKAEISVKVVDKDINKAVTLNVKSKMDVTKHQKMVIIPKLNTVGGEIAEEVGISEKYDAQYYAESNKIVVGPKDDDWTQVSKGNFEEDITVTVAGIPCKYKVKTKILAAKPTVKIAAVTFAKSAFPGSTESPLTGETNILATYKMNGKTFSMEPATDTEGNALVTFPNGTASDVVEGGYLDNKTNTIVKYDAETGKILVQTTPTSTKGTVKVEITYPGQTAPMKKSFKIVTK